MALGGGVGEIQSTGGGLKRKGSYNATTNYPPLFDGVGENGTIYQVAVGGTRDFSSNPELPNVIELVTDDYLWLSEGKWLKIDQTFVDDISTYATVAQVQALIAAATNFNGNRTITRSGWPAVNAGGTTIKDWLENLGFPAVPPGASISFVGGSTRQFGAPVAVTINWTVTKNTNPITAITVAGDSVTPTGNSQSGSVTKNATANVTTTYSVVVIAGSQVVTASLPIVWSHKRYWGRSTKDGIITPLIDSDILALTGASSGSGSEFSSTRVQTRNSINGAGQFLVFAWPTSFGAPSFTVNGLPNTAWTKVRANTPFVNSDGYTENYDVWVSNTVQNSPLNISIG
jgi:hypothetical protein